MSTMVDRPQQFGQALHRKPLPPPGSTTRTAPSYSQVVPDHSGHSRTRTSSSSVFPPVSASPAQYPQGMPPQYQQQGSQNQQSTRRTLSNATSSTASTTHSGGAPGLNRTNSDLRRSSSTRSGNSPTSYVALMRKQKATVWCATAQYEDPRMQAQQRAAKMKALQEVAGGHIRAGPRTSTSSSVAAGVRSKIRHHGAPKASLYAPANLAGTGVPMRLSASEVDEGDSEDTDSFRQKDPYHHRTGSGRSSLGSGRRVPYGNPQGRLSTASTPPSGHSNSPPGEMADLPEEETPVPNYPPAREYFTEPTKTGLSGGSGSSGERENSFGGLGQMPQHTAPKVDEYRKTSDELRRRGSVDDRTMTMSGAGRLYIANPDLSD